MMRRKNAVEYVVLALYIMCMGLALSASLEYVTRATDREYLNQGKWVLSMAAIIFALFFAVRLSHKVSFKLNSGIKTGAWLGICALLFAAGLLCRIWVIRNIPVEPDSDFETYYRIANHLLNDTLLTPEGEADREYIALYPHTLGFPMLVLRPVFAVFGASVQNALYANLALSMLSVIIAGHMAYRISGKTGSVLVVALMSLWPSHIFFSNMIATEPAFTLLLLIAADIMLLVMDRRKNTLYARNPGAVIFLLALLGIVLAVAGAIRPMAVILLAAYAVVQLTVKGDPSGEIPVSGVRYAISRSWICIVIVLIFYAAAGGIVSRMVSDTILETPASGLTASGYNMMVGLNTESQGVWNEEDAEFFAQAYDETGSANEAHGKCLEVALKRFRDEPENVLNLMVYKFRDLWQTDDFGVDWNLLWTGQQGTLTPELSGFLENVRPVGRIMYMAVLLTGLIGILEVWRRQRAPHAIIMISVLFFLGTALAHMLLETQVRYHYNMIPFLILLAGYAVTAWRERIDEEPPLRVIYVQRGQTSENIADHTRFDMASAIREGNVRVSVTKMYSDEADAIETQTGAEEHVPDDTGAEADIASAENGDGDTEKMP